MRTLNKRKAMFDFDSVSPTLEPAEVSNTDITWNSLLFTSVGNVLGSLAATVNLPLSALIAGTTINQALLNAAMNTITASSGTGTTTVGTNQHDELIGNSGANYLVGGGGTDKLTGGAGADTLLGGDGDDFLQGGAGLDYLDGGAGADRFYFTEADLVTKIGEYDTIAQFRVSQNDKIVLSAIDANTNVAGNQAFTFLGKGNFTGAGGELRYYYSGENTMIVADIDGDTETDLRILIPEVRTMNASDFIL